jgi:hypothetical protein
MRSILARCFLAGLALISCAGVLEGAVTATGIGDGVSASATFERVGDRLVVTLTNSSSGDATGLSQVLTGVFFNTSSPVTLRAVGAVLGDGSEVQFGDAPNGQVGGEWAHAEGKKVSKRSGRSQGIGGANLGGGSSVGKADFGLISDDDDPTTGDKHLTGRNAFIQQQVSFVFEGLPEGFDPLTEITDVMFQFGTNAKRDPRLIGELAAAVASYADAVNKILPEDLPEEEVQPPAVNPAPNALLGGLALLAGLFMHRHRRAVAC